MTAGILKIAHIDTGRDFRGGQDLLLSLARGLKQRGHIQLIVCPQDSPLAKRAAGEGQDVMPLGSVGKLRSYIRNEKFDIVHAHDAKAQTISFRASLGLPVRRVASRQVAFTPRHPLIHRWKYGRTCDGVIANSQSVRQVLLAAGVPDSHIEVISPGVEIPKELPSPKARARGRAPDGISLRTNSSSDTPKQPLLARKRSGCGSSCSVVARAKASSRPDAAGRRWARS